MDNKYFTPSIEDIRVGYECEMNDARGYKDSFTPVIIGFKEAEGAYTHQISEIIHMMDDGYGEVRVPYLTKEQIEAEGWKETAGHGVYTRGNSLLGFARPSGGLPMIWINNKNRDYIQYQGVCKDINTFRYICKLLNIN